MNVIVNTYTAPTVNALRRHLYEAGCDADPTLVATALLALAYEGGWVKYPHNAADWIERLAVDLARENHG